MPVSKISRARTLARNHWRSQRLLRRAFAAERRTLIRLQPALHHQPAAALRTLRRIVVRQSELEFRVVLGIPLTNAQSALRNLADSPPLAPRNREHLAHQFLRLDVSFPPYRSLVLVLDLGSPLLQLRNAHQDTLQNIERLKSGHDNRHPVLFRDRLILRVTHYCANVSGRQESLHL